MLAGKKENESKKKKGKEKVMGGGGKKEKTETKQKVIYYRGSKCDIRTRNIPEINKQVMSSHTI